MNVLAIPIRKLRNEAFCRLLVLRFHHNFVFFHLLCPKHALRDDRIICNFLEYAEQLDHCRLLDNFFHGPLLFHENVELDFLQIEDVRFDCIFHQISIKVLQVHDKISVVDVFDSLRIYCAAFKRCCL